MNRHSRVLPFPQGKGKEKDKSSHNASGSKPHLSGSSIASSSRGVAKSGIKSVKGLVNSLSVVAKANHSSSKEKHGGGGQTCAPSISAAVAAASAVPNRPQNKVEPSDETVPATIEAKNVKPVASSAPEQQDCDNDKISNPKATSDSADGGVPITDIKSLENLQITQDELPDDEPSSEPRPVGQSEAESSSPESSSPESSTPESSTPESSTPEEDCTTTAAAKDEVEQCKEIVCGCPKDKENCECSSSGKDLQKDLPSSYLAVVGKQKVHESVRETFKLRLLCPEDVPEVKALCGDWFPVEYPDSWYHDITSDSRFHSLAAVINNEIVGLLVSEVKARARLHREDSTILSSAFPSITQVAYILSLGVVSTFRRLGIATALLTNLLNYLNTHDKLNIKAVYLHVLASNTNAISFYEKHSFRRHEYLPYYYAIRGKGKDGLSYVLYVNGGQPPWTLLYPFQCICPTFQLRWDVMIDGFCSYPCLWG
ncbi:hypothetical protein BSL78_15687 [Apostichopus japonicus]|uniref:N-alpha-acetyltransferase 60 n=1 Tax=Stichopus japonicus TaxID=307972 RepID=A0A2G8KHG8_STIJA|nr:hypothetical protein BSL78_15687 [Apostichopus japonicus]